ncbi:MAG: ATP-binding protein [Alphaproteobacteria bacterium]|nr:ATP-binding protein [Alphaproteobacteria bacterium]MCK5555984.1 ATP-binding protein [Alphaproteobacteria bacterium]MCK5658288.1 ATP-binding protein [Alphaproteobacteria bacterium]
MRLKSFHAKSMSEAMRQVRSSLGGDAVIVTSREEASGWVRITAAVEQLNSAPEYEEEQDGFDADEVAEMITDILLKHRVPASVSGKIISTAMTLFGKDPKKMFAEALQKTFSFSPTYAEKKRKPIVLVGPPGAGKTLMAAKMAARAVMDGQKPAIITTDIARAGGVEQLSAFLNILSLPLLQAEDAKGLRDVLAKTGNSTQTIIDTGGLNPFDPQEMKFLARLISVEEMEPALVLPAGTDAEESAEIAMTFSVLGVKRFIPTRLDFARRLGGILSAADRAGLSFTEGSHTPQVANGILTVTPEALANLLMPHSPKRGKVKP